MTARYSRRGTARNVAGAAFEAELWESAKGLEDKVWEWTKADRSGNSYREAIGDEPGTMTLAQGHPRCVGKPGQMKPVEANAVDFVGVCHLPPTAVAFDAKSNTGAVSFKLDLTLGTKKPDRRQALWLDSFHRHGGLAGYLVADQRQQVAYWLGHEDVVALLEGHRITYASKAKGRYITSRVALFRSARTQMVTVEAVHTGEGAVHTGEFLPALGSVLWDLGALFRVLRGVSDVATEQGLVAMPGDEFTVLR